MKLLYKFASRSRPKKFFDALDNIHSLSRHDDFEVLATLDIDDASMANSEVRDRIKKYPMVRAYWGTSNSKIHSINRDMEFAGAFDVLLLHSDDMEFTVDGFDLEILKAFENWEGLVHFPDQVAKARLITYPMMHRKYFQRDNWIYHRTSTASTPTTFNRTWQRRGVCINSSIKIFFYTSIVYGGSLLLMLCCFETKTEKTTKKTA